MDRLKVLLVAAAVAVAVSVVAAGPAFAAKGGNNDTAKVCQQGGWKTLVPDAGGTFANQGDCVNDGAQGSFPFGTAGAAACNAIRGSIFSIERGDWECRYQPSRMEEAHRAALQTACDSDGGRDFSVKADDPSGFNVAICFRR
jgi:hypothetical protein